MLKYGIIGTGSISHQHIKVIEKIPEVEIVALCDPNKENLSRALKAYPKLKGVELFSDYHLLLESPEIDAVVICTPNYTHAKIAIASLESGKHVLCEKPMATTPKECYQMVKTAKDTGKILEIGFKFRYSSLFESIKKMIDEEKIGKLRMIVATEFRKPFVGPWRRIMGKSGGPLVEESVHFFDLFNWLSESESIRVCSFGGGDVLKDFQGVDNAQVIVEYEGGIRANLNFYCFTYSPKFEFLVIGEKGRLEANLFSSSIIYYNGKEEKEEIQLSEAEFGFLGEHKEFKNCIEKDRKPLTSGEESLKAMLIAFYAEESIKKSEIIKIKSAFGK